MIRFPWLRRFFPQKPYAATRPTNRDRFEAVFTTRRWAVGQSVSGPGSDRDSGQVIHTLEVLTRVCRDHDVRSVADIPCGDFNWMDGFLSARPNIPYIGYDIVPALIEQNRVNHPEHRFEVLDITCQTPPAVDLIVCKDLVNHLFERDVWAALANMAASGSRLILITSNAGETNEELDLLTPGSSRPLNLSAAPYNLPEALYADHYLSLWSGLAISRRLAERAA